MPGREEEQERRRGRMRRTCALARSQRGCSGRPWRLGSMQEDEWRGLRRPAPGMERRIKQPRQQPKRIRYVPSSSRETQRTNREEGTQKKDLRGPFIVLGLEKERADRERAEDKHQRLSDRHLQEMDDGQEAALGGLGGGSGCSDLDPAAGRTDRGGGARGRQRGCRRR